MDDWLLEELCAFDADAEDLEDADGEPEPDEVDGPSTVVDFVPPKWISLASRLAEVVALALLLVTAPLVKSNADQGSVIAPLPMSTAQAPAQCCRICRKGQLCGDACISSTKQCKKEPGCACSAASAP